LARALGSSIIARGALELLWEHCYESGEEYVGLSDDIEAMVGWSGERGMLTQALADAGAPEGYGFIEPVDASEPGRYRVHDLWHHAPDYVIKRRKRELDRQNRSAPNGSQRPPLLDCQTGDVRPPSPSHSPSPSPSPVQEPARARFERFWSVYPRKEGKDAAWREWLKRSPADDLLETMIAAVQRQKASPQWRKDGGQFIPQPRTWLHQGRWQDEPQSPEAKPQTPDWYGHFPHCRNETVCAQKFLEEERAKQSKAVSV
jgi:hypothetical protein